MAEAAFVAATGLDTFNTSVAHTIREIEPDVPILATARDPASVDILGVGRLHPGHRIGTDARPIDGPAGAKRQRCHSTGDRRF